MPQSHHYRRDRDHYPGFQLFSYKPIKPDIELLSQVDTPISDRMPPQEPKTTDEEAHPFAELQATFEQLAESCAQAQRAMSAKCFRFYLVEKEYTHSPLASGVLFEDGTVALRFYSKTRTRHLGNTFSYHSLKELLFQDGKEGRCVIQWIDGPPPEETYQ